MKVFGFDVDGVVANFGTPYMKYLSGKTGIPMTEDDINCWNWHRQFGISDDYHMAMFMEFSENGGFATLPPKRSAIKWLKSIISIYSAYFITHRPKCARNSTLNWFAKHFPEVDPTTIFITDEKGKVAMELGITHFVDDKLDNVIEVSEAGVKNCVLLTLPHNKNLSAPGITRAANWDDLMLQWGLSKDLIPIK